jgi:hypothetical protein
MNSDETSFVRQLTAQTDVAIDRGYGTMNTRYCKLSVIASKAGIVTQLDTEDSNAGVGLPGAIGMYGSICENRLGMERQS